MIRINLLRVRAARERKKVSGITQVALILALLLVEIVAIIFLEVRLSRQIAAKEDEIRQVQAALSSKRNQMADVDQKRQELEKINRKKQVIQELQAARTGPKYMLLELMTILSKADGPTMDEATRRWLAQNPEAGFHRDWDPRRLWLAKFEEADRVVTIEGMALDVEDITEFQRRLNLSQYFDDVRWVSSPEAGSSEAGPSAYRFTLRARVIYQ